MKTWRKVVPRKWWVARNRPSGIRKIAGEETPLILSTTWDYLRGTFSKLRWIVNLPVTRINMKIVNLKIRQVLPLQIQPSIIPQWLEREKKFVGTICTIKIQRKSPDQKHRTNKVNYFFFHYQYSEPMTKFFHFYNFFLIPKLLFDVAF